MGEISSLLLCMFPEFHFKPYENQMLSSERIEGYSLLICDQAKKQTKKIRPFTDLKICAHLKYQAAIKRPYLQRTQSLVWETGMQNYSKCKKHHDGGMD